MLVRMEAGGICGSDLPMWRGRDSLERPDGNPHASGLPGYPMHEVAGVVEASRFPALSVGQRVVGWGTSHAGLAEAVVTEGSALFAFDDSLTPLKAVQMQTLACVLDTIDRCPAPSAVGRATVLGLGPIGLLFTRALKLAGVGFVEGVDMIDRQAVASAYGIDRFVHSTVDRWVKNLDDAERPELVVEVIGHDPQTLGVALEGCAPRGFVFCFGVPDVAVYPMPLNTLLRKNLTLASGFVLDRPAWLARAQEMVLSGTGILDDYATDVFGVSEVDAAFTAAASTRPDRVKVLVDFGRD